MYKVEMTKKVIKQLKKLDKPTALLLKTWMYKNLYDTDNPRKHGKQLKGNLSHLWRYRIGDYRLVVHIQDEVLIIATVTLAHRREVYKDL